jgi:hypothetical protein
MTQLISFGSESQRRRGLNEAGVVAALFVGDVLGHVGRGAAVLTSQGQPLQEAQQHEQYRGREPDARIGGQKADQRRADAHGDHGYEECVLAADEIADVSEDDRA